MDYDEYFQYLKDMGQVYEGTVTMDIADDKVKEFLRLMFDIKGLKLLYETQIENENYEVCSAILEVIKEKENEEVHKDI